MSLSGIWACLCVAALVNYGLLDGKGGWGAAVEFVFISGATLLTVHIWGKKP